MINPLKLLIKCNLNHYVIPFDKNDVILTTKVVGGSFLIANESYTGIKTLAADVSLFDLTKELKSRGVYKSTFYITPDALTDRLKLGFHCEIESIEVLMKESKLTSVLSLSDFIKIKRDIKMHLVINGKTKIYNALLTREAITDLWGRDENTSLLENFEKHSEKLLGVIYSDVPSDKVTRGLRVLLTRNRSVIQQFTDYVLEGFPNQI